MRKLVLALLLVANLPTAIAQSSVCFGANCSSDYEALEESIMNVALLRSNITIANSISTLDQEDDEDQFRECIEDCRQAHQRNTGLCRSAAGFDAMSYFDEEEGNTYWNYNLLSACVDAAQEELVECIAPAQNCFP